MKTLIARTTAFGRAPGTGGSGGGPNKGLYPKPEPQALLGLNSTVVYGSNVQIAFPINFQMAIGSNLQICISPNAWATLYADSPAATLPHNLNDLLGSGLGGNMQLTMGTSANFVMGQVFDINLGPQRITLDVHKNSLQSLIKLLGTVAMAAAGVFLIAYAASPDDDARSILCMAFQLLMQGLILALMDTKKIYLAMDKTNQDTLNQSFGWDPNTKTGPTFADTFGGTSALGEALVVTAVSAAMILPVLLEIGGEIRLAQPDDPNPGDGPHIGTIQQA